MCRVMILALVAAVGATGFGDCRAEGTTVYVTGKIRPSLLTICPCADPIVLDDNSLGEDLFLRGADLVRYDGAFVEIVGERVDCGDCVKIDVRDIAFLPNRYAYGDVSGDNVCNPQDVVIAINYLLKNGPYPANGWRSADLDANGETNLADLVRLVGLVYGRAATVQGAVWGKLLCSNTVAPYPGCKYWIIKNAMPLDTGTADNNGKFTALLPRDRYSLRLFPPESHLPGDVQFDLTNGNVLLPAPVFDRVFIDSLLLVTLQPGVPESRLNQIMGYLGGHSLGAKLDEPVVKYVVALPKGLHVDRAAAILRLFPEIVAVEPMPILCPN